LEQWMDDPQAPLRGALLQVPASGVRDLVHHPGAGCIPRRGHALFHMRSGFYIQAARFQPPTFARAKHLIF
jgi:hypothetical protein